jgi:predicted PurR-regulated permease PerM
LRGSLSGENRIVKAELRPTMGETAKRAFVATLVAGSVIVLGLALWKIRIIVSLVFLGFVIAAAMRPGVEALRGLRVPRGAGVILHYVVLFGLVALLLWFAVPRALNQVEQALGTNGLPTKAQDLEKAKQHSTGIKHDILAALQKRLQRLPKASNLVHPALSAGKKAVEVVVAIFFTFATAAYWIFERDRAISLFTRLLERPRRKRVRDTWDLIDAKLGAFVRGQLLLIALVGTILSLAFWAIGVPYWILIGSFAGIVEIVPVIGPLAAGILAVGAGLTVSAHTAVLAGIAVLAVRLAEDYVIVPRVLGDAVGLSPLVVLVSVTAVGVLFGGFAVLLAVPLAAVLATVVDVAVFDKDPTEEDVPTVLFSAKESEAG